MGKYCRGLVFLLVAVSMSACSTLRAPDDAVDGQNQTERTAQAPAGDAATDPGEAPTASAGGEPGPMAGGLPPELAFLEEEEDFENDPFETFNRRMYKFNSTLDKYVLKPVARGYDKIAPEFVRRGVGNFFRNLFEPTIIINGALQGKWRQSASDTARFVVNTTVGLLGLIDVASPIGLPRHEEDFGQTLGVWGAQEGPYLVLPFFGSRTVRDSFGLVADWYSDPLTYVRDSDIRWGTRSFGVVEYRAQLLGASSVLEQAAGDDEYLFVREAYRQRRRNLVYDGNVPPDKR